MVIMRRIKSIIVIMALLISAVVMAQSDMPGTWFE